MGSLIKVLGVVVVASLVNVGSVLAQSLPLGNVTPSSTKLTPINPTEKKRCCVTYLSGRSISTGANPNSYSNTDEIYTCPPGEVGVTVRDNHGPDFTGVYCKSLDTSCQWVDSSQNSVTKQVTFYYWTSGSWKSQSYTYSAPCT